MIFERTGKRERGREREREKQLSRTALFSVSLSPEKKKLFSVFFFGLERRASTLTTPSSPSLSTLK